MRKVFTVVTVQKVFTTDYDRDLILLVCYIFKRSSIKTFIFFILCVVCIMFEMSESEVGDFDNQSTVQQTIRAFQATVKLQLTFVNILHSLQMHTKRCKLLFLSARVLTTALLTTK